MANLANTKWCKNRKKCLKLWHIGTHLRVLTGSYSINTDMTGFRWLSKDFCILELWSKLAPALEGLISFIYLRNDSYARSEIVETNSWDINTVNNDSSLGCFKHAEQSQCQWRFPCSSSSNNTNLNENTVQTFNSSNSRPEVCRCLVAQTPIVDM